MCNYIKVPCKHCPFRNDVTPFLHPDRAADLAYAAQNTYNTFTCHKTLEYDDESEDTCVGENSKECAGFLTLRAKETSEGIPEGFEPSWDIVYDDAWDMIDAYEHEWNKKH